MSLVLAREALSNQIADDLATRNTNAGLIEGAVNGLESAETAIKGTGWTDENLVDHESRIVTIEGNVDQDVGVSSTPSFNGISFPATAVPSADPNTLDDYEEGSWIPTLGPGIPTYETQVGRYVKIGNMVYITAAISINNKGTLAGNIYIGGIPFTTANITGLATASYIGRFNGVTYPSGKTSLHISGLPNSSLLYLMLGGSATRTNVVADTLILDDFLILFSSEYLIL